MDNCWAVVVAAGRGRRLHLSINKVLYALNGRSVLRRGLDALASCELIKGVVLVLSEDDVAAYQGLIAREGECDKVKKVVIGGATRQQSVYNGLMAVPEDADLVAIHDGARAFVPEEVVRRAIECAKEYGSGVAATTMIDTVKRINERGEAIETLRRDELRAVQTPQVFRRADIISAHEIALRDGFTATDDAALMERYFGTVKLSVTEEGLSNRKLTTREDLRMMERLLGPRLRVGHGFDAHRFKQGRRLVLCGVEVPFDMGLDGHSDADVAAHALMDALLGAAGLGDIGRMFPDTDPETEGISSMELLKKVVSRLDEIGKWPINCDVTIVAQKPRLSPYIALMRDNLAKELGIKPDCVNVKATTTEHMGYEGRGEGISAHAVALIGG